METQNNNERFTLDNIKRHYSDTYIQKLVNDFYQFICDLYISYRSNKQNKKQKQNISVDNQDNNSDDEEENSIISEDFIKYFMYQFFKLKGIRRKIVGKNMFLLSYDKDHTSYNPDDNVTKLCRHLILDTSCLRIVSLGIPRRNNVNNLDTSKMNDFNVEIQYDGSMVIYNPALKHNPRIYKEREYTNDKEEIIKKPIDVIFSTRNKVGTSNFNSEDTFKIICLRNFKNLDFDLDKLNNGFETLNYVFNVMDQTEHIANDNVNLLVGCYQFKSEEECSTACQKINSITNINQQSQKLLNVMFQDLNRNMVSSLDISSIASIYSEMKLPERLEKDKANITKSTELLKDLPYTYKGVTIWDNEGARYKLSNSNFEKIRDLRGNLPINLLECNNKSLFTIYLRLKSENNIDLFLSYFDKDKSYKQKFVQFKKDIQEFTDLVHQWYLDSYVLKNKIKDEIPNYLYPLCFELHGIYMKNKNTIKKKDVLDYLYTLDVMSLYGRIYTPIPDNRNLKSEEQSEQVSNQETEQVSNQETEQVSNQETEQVSNQ